MRALQGLGVLPIIFLDQNIQWDLLLAAACIFKVFGTTCGVGARSAVGMSLPHGMATEVECIFELHMEGGGDAGTASGGSDGSQTSAAFAKALGSSGLAEAVQILKAEAPRDWLIYGSSIESNLKAHFVARRAEKSDGTIL